MKISISRTTRASEKYEWVQGNIFGFTTMNALISLSRVKRPMKYTLDYRSRGAAPNPGKGLLALCKPGGGNLYGDAVPKPLVKGLAPLQTPVFSHWNMQGATKPQRLTTPNQKTV
jgi:hypothetical protein